MCSVKPKCLEREGLAYGSGSESLPANVDDLDTIYVEHMIEATTESQRLPQRTPVPRAFEEFRASLTSSLPGVDCQFLFVLSNPRKVFAASLQWVIDAFRAVERHHAH